MSEAVRMPRRRWLVWLLVPAGILLFAGANIHLVYVAVTSEPDCVPHLKTSGTGGGYAAAKPSC